MSEEIIIDSDIPVPKKGRAGAKWSSAGLAMKKLKVGQSFSIHIYHHRTQPLRYHAVQAGIKISIFNIKEDLYRIWRTE